jgi:hypothetical protein
MTSDRLAIGTAVLRGLSNGVPGGGPTLSRRVDSGRRPPHSAALQTTTASPADLAQTPYVPGTPLSAALRQDIVRRYTVDQDSMTAIAAAIGCSYGAVHDALTRAQVAKRPRGGSRKRSQPAAEGPRPAEHRD